MLQFQEVMSIYKIEFWCELTTAILIWENVDLYFRKKYTLTSRLGGKVSTFRRTLLTLIYYMSSYITCLLVLIFKKVLQQETMQDTI